VIVVKVVNDQLRVVDRIRERVALAEGLDSDGRLTDEAMARSLACLERFGQRLAELPRGAVRAVGTNTLRRARNSDEFIDRGTAALRHEIEVISGKEEARLVYLGVARSLEGQTGRRLVVDIGGGSTECILGEGYEVELSNSMFMGCVGYSRRYFPDGVIDAESLERAEVAARLQLRAIEKQYRSRGWEHCLGSSGTCHAICEILEKAGWSDHGVTRQGLKQLGRALLRAGHVDDIAFEGLAEERAPVLAGGYAILSALMKAFRVDVMDPASGALREGVVHDLLGRMRHHDARDVTVGHLERRHEVDVAQSARVEAEAVGMFEQVAGAWGFDAESDLPFLRWAARLHEIGLTVSYSGYHRHGAYIVEHGDLPGFSRHGQRILALLILCHRRRLRHELFGSLRDGDTTWLRMCVLLRLAVRFHRTRSDSAGVSVRLEPIDGGLELDFTETDLDDLPLLSADLELEARRLKDAGFKLKIR
jgi:exopolyphosphatase/guanosine-5'-triphosphate,3'-diphosphate pyrophosphatase